MLKQKQKQRNREVAKLSCHLVLFPTLFPLPCRCGRLIRLRLEHFNGCKICASHWFCDLVAISPSALGVVWRLQSLALRANLRTIRVETDDILSLSENSIQQGRQFCCEFWISHFLCYQVAALPATTWDPPNSSPTRSMRSKQGRQCFWKRCVANSSQLETQATKRGKLPSRGLDISFCPLAYVRNYILKKWAGAPFHFL